MGAEQPFPIAVNKKVNCTRWHDACKIRTEAFEVCPPAFGPGNRHKNLHGFAPVEEGAAEKGQSGGWRDAACRAGGGELGLVKVALKTGAEDIKRGGNERCSHPS